MRIPRALLVALALSAPACRCARDHAPGPVSLGGHPVVLDRENKLLPWAPYDRVARLAFDRLAHFPIEDNHLMTWWSYSRFAPPSLHGVEWPYNPAGLNAMLVDSALGWYAFSGDRGVVEMVRKSVDYELSHGLTPKGEGWIWDGVPFASADPGATEYRGADDSACEHCGRGDGLGVIEPDKVGELGYALLRLWEATGEARYRDEALACADRLATHVSPGSEDSSPWPFRVAGKDGFVREKYSSHVLGALMLFDEATRLALGDGELYRRARAVAWNWLMAYPAKNGNWSGYFEDIAMRQDPAENPNQYAPMQLAKYVMDHPALDPDWRLHTKAWIDWTASTFAGDANGESGMQYGAEVLSEQAADMAKMSSHTARFAAVNARYFELTGDVRAKERAYRSFNWATYWCDEKGVVKVGADDGEGWWFTDGYGDFIRHFVQGMASVPDWAPAGEDHLLRSTSVVTDVHYDEGAIRYSTFDADATDVLRLRAAPNSITLGERTLAETMGDREGYSIRAIDQGVVVRIRRLIAGEVRISLAPS